MTHQATHGVTNGVTDQAVAIVIVTYNSSAEIAACLRSTRLTNAKVLVIDNGSADNTVAIASALGFEVIANETNAGFAAAVNQGVRATTAPFVLLLNPDAILQTGIDALVEQCTIPEAGAAGGQLLSESGVVQTGFNVRKFPTPATFLCEALLLNRLWPRNPVNWRYRCLGLDLSRPLQVDQPAGAFLLFRREAWQRVGGFDEGFFPIWFEDVDFCKRIANDGFRIFYTPQAVALHRGAHSIAHLEAGTRIEYWYCSLLRYSIVHFSPGGRVLTSLGIMAGSVLRLLFGLRNFQVVRGYLRVTKLAFRSIWTRRMKAGERFS